MAWLRSEQSVLHHPKTKLLQSYLGIGLDATIGRLHMLWYWCLDYAIDGDLSKKDPKIIEQSCEIPLKLLVKAGFVDARPYRRIHDWWQNQGNYLKVRYKNKAEDWQRIEALYKRQDRTVHGTVQERSIDGSNDMDVPYNTDGRRIRTDGREKQYSKDASSVPPLARGPSAALTKVDQEDAPEFGHEDFLKVGWISSDKPVDSDAFGWDHFNRAMTEVERVQSKMREKFYAQKKHWN